MINSITHSLCHAFPFKLIRHQLIELARTTCIQILVTFSTTFRTQRILLQNTRPTNQVDRSGCFTQGGFSSLVLSANNLTHKVDSFVISQFCNQLLVKNKVTSKVTCIFASTQLTHIEGTFAFFRSVIHVSIIATTKYFSKHIREI